MKHKFLIYFASTLCLLGCSEDFLDPEPHSFYTPENALLDKEGLEATLATCGSLVRDEFYSHAAPIWAEYIFSDIAIMGGDDDNIPIDLDLRITPDTEDGLNKDAKIRPFGEKWWKIIGHANIIINRIGNAKIDSEEERNSILGEAYFYRAYAYYRLVHQFGDVPLSLEEIKTPRIDFVTFSRESILKKMRDDMKESVKYLPVAAIHGKVNKAAANHLLTKIHLSLGEFDEAIQAANAVINDGVHALMTNRFGVFKDREIETEGFQAYANNGSVRLDVIYDLHRPENKSHAENKEAIFNVVDRNGFDDAGAKDQVATMRNCTPYWNRTGVIKTPDGVNGMMRDWDEFNEYRVIGRGQGFLRMSNWLAYEVWTEDKDLRHKQPNWWRMEDLIYNNKALKDAGNPYYGTHVITQDVGPDSIRCWSPFFNKFIIEDLRMDQPNGHHSDWYVFRLAETYLLRAEAYFWKGDVIHAAKDLNEVHMRAGCDPISSSDVTMDVILDERAKELYYEEPRKCELTRIAYIYAKTGKSYNGTVYSLENFSESNFFYDRINAKNNFYRDRVLSKNGERYKISPWHVLWPIPYEVRDANMLGHINQNKGYSGCEDNITPKNYPEDYISE